MHSVYTGPGIGAFWTSADNSRITGLTKVTGVSYAAIEASGSDKNLLLLADGKTFGKAINQLAVNDLILFKTKEGKLGLLKITETTGSSNTTAVMSFDGLVQK